MIEDIVAVHTQGVNPSLVQGSLRMHPDSASLYEVEKTSKNHAPCSSFLQFVNSERAGACVKSLALRDIFTAKTVVLVSIQRQHAVNFTNDGDK